jgi:hypothetical protein
VCFALGKYSIGSHAQVGAPTRYWTWHLLDQLQWCAVLSVVVILVGSTCTDMART